MLDRYTPVDIHIPTAQNTRQFDQKSLKPNVITSPVNFDQRYMMANNRYSKTRHQHNKFQTDILEIQGRKTGSISRAGNEKRSRSKPF